MRKISMFWMLSFLFISYVSAVQSSDADKAVVIRVDASGKKGLVNGAWSWVGYDEPNYTYMKYGRKLLGELSALSPFPVYVRCHNLLTSGDGTPALKWGSTNAYTEDADGKAVYDWTIIDRIFDTYRDAGVRPLVEIGFMPKALSTKPEPYQHSWPKTEIDAGWSYPPKDYEKWSGLVSRWVEHSIERYGRKDVENWYWELWNEPDIMYWKGTREEFFKLYDYTTAAVRKSLPDARFGGPHCTGPGGRSVEYLKAFLEHCAEGQNNATGKKGAPLDYIAFHPKGATKMVEGHVQMGLANQLRSVNNGFQVVSSFPKYRNTPIVLGESDPEGLAALSAKKEPSRGYRNGAQYGAYLAASYARTLELAQRHKVNLLGVVTWAFEFEDTPFFEGYRTLATNGIDKPVLNVMRLFGMMTGDYLAVENDAKLALDDILKNSVRDAADINALAARQDKRITILVWNYHDDAVAVSARRCSLQIDKLPAAMKQAQVRHFRVDDRHSNAYTAWLEIGSPQSPTEAQYAQLEKAAQLEMLNNPTWMPVEKGSLVLEFDLPRQAVSLVEITWQ
jgi:xylan 1,4-beta-xylosidase